MYQGRRLRLKNEVLIIMAYAVVFLVVSFWIKGAIGTALGLPMALILPGYAIVSALFPKKEPISGWKRFALSLLVQILIVPSLGLAMHFTSFGLQTFSLVALSSGTVLIASTIAYYRRSRTSPDDRFELSIPIPEAWWPRSGAWDKVLSVVVLMAAVLAAAAFVFAVAKPIQREHVTEFYVLGPDGRAGNYTRDISVGRTVAFTLGVANDEQTPMTYDVQTVVDGVPHGERLHVGTLEPGTSWQERVDFASTTPGLRKLQFLLYVQGQSEPYREIHLWINVPGG